MGKKSKKRNVQPQKKTIPLQKHWSEILLEENVLLPLIFGVALLLRIIYILQLRDAEFFENLIDDMAAWYNLAKDLFTGKGFSTLYYPPGYISFLAFLRMFCGDDHLFPRIAQAFLSAGSCALAYLICGKLFNKPVAIICAVLCVFHQELIFTSGEFMPQCFNMFLLTLCVYLTILVAERNSIVLQLITGVTAGFAVWVRGDTAVFIPFLFIWVWIRTGKFVESVRKTIFVFIAICVIVGAIIVRNYFYFHSFVFVSSNMGVNLWMGNNPGSSGKYGLPEEYKPYIPEGEEDILVQQKLFQKITMRYIKEFPKDILRVAGYKFLIFFSTDQPWNYEERALHSYLSKVPLFSFWLLLPLTITGFLLSFRQWKESFLTAIPVVGSALIYIIITVQPRYRIPILVFFTIYAAYIIYYIWTYFRTKRYVALTLIVAFVVLSRVILSANPKNINEFAILYENFAQGLRSQGMEDRAGEYAKKAETRYLDDIDWAIFPHAKAKSMYHLAGLYSQEGKYREAEELYLKAYKLNPNDFYLTIIAASMDMNKGKYAEAIRKYERALKIRPHDINLLLQMSGIYVHRKNPTKAEEMVKKAIRVNPEYGKPYQLLAELYFQKMEYAKTIDTVGKALKYGARNQTLYYMLGVSYRGIGDYASARDWLNKAIEIDPATEIAVQADRLASQLNFVLQNQKR